MENERAFLLPYIRETYGFGGFEERDLEFWEFNENIAGLVSARVAQMERNIELEFKVP